MTVLLIIPGDKHPSFQKLASVFMEYLLHCFRESDFVVDVFDVYDNKVSVKSAERERRQNAGSAGRQYQVIAGRSIPPCKKCMALSKNKESLSQFLCQYVTKKTCHLRIGTVVPRQNFEIMLPSRVKWIVSVSLFSYNCHQT